ncbi:hypothetical protein LTR85_007788 [Meristemomyces frigidus]|nr:hypothetical protein LTR85_007788 [Meristemomyces frigidus]
MAPNGSAYNVDWIFSIDSNVPVDNHRDSFTSFIEFKTYLGPAVFLSQTSTEVVGIGDVELGAPSVVTNILGGPILEDYGLVFAAGGGKLTDREKGGSVGLLDAPCLMKLCLKARKKGMTSLDPNGLRQHRNDGQTYINPLRNPSKQCSLSIHREEKKWLKDNYRGEFHFLREHGLSMHMDEDRNEGRRIARSVMEAEGEGAHSSDAGKDDEGDFLADLAADPMSHLADRFFSEKELDWIQKHCRHSGNFCFAYGLKAYDDEDCKKGMAIARACMSEKAGD